MTAIRNRRASNLATAAWQRHTVDDPTAERGFQRGRASPGKTLSCSGSVCDDCNVVKRVLIVDDHEPFRAVARELLEGAGYVVAGEAADAAEALAAVAAEAPDAVLLDIQLPDGDGFSVATALMGAGGPAVVLISSRAAEDYGKRIEAAEHAASS